MIKGPNKDGKYRLFTHDGSKPLGPWTTKAKALKQEHAIQFAKHGGGK